MPNFHSVQPTATEHTVNIVDTLVSSYGLSTESTSNEILITNIKSAATRARQTSDSGVILYKQCSLTCVRTKTVGES